MTLVLDAGALLALEKNDRESWRRWKSARVACSPPITHGGVVGQVWRGGGPRQARLAMALDGIEVYPLDDKLGRRSGGLLKRTGTSDVIDAALVLLAEDGDEIVTSDPDDLTVLSRHAGLDVELYPVLRFSPGCRRSAGRKRTRSGCPGRSTRPAAGPS